MIGRGTAGKATYARTDTREIWAKGNKREGEKKENKSEKNAKASNSSIKTRQKVRPKRGY